VLIIARHLRGKSSRESDFGANGSRIMEISAVCQRAAAGWRRKPGLIAAGLRADFPTLFSSGAIVVRTACPLGFQVNR
jgi:hypothetical protein